MHMIFMELSLDGDKGAPNPEGAPQGVCDCQSYRVKAEMGWLSICQNNNC